MLRPRVASTTTRLGRALDRLAARLADPPAPARADAAGGAGPTAARAAARAAGRIGRAAVGFARGERGRRLARVGALAVAVAVLVTVLYDHGDVPGAAARPTAGPARPAGAGPAGERPPRVRPRPAVTRPAEAAAAWYAAAHQLPKSRVRALQQDRVSSREVRVLVLADGGRGRLRTALVRVRRGPHGWAVP